MRHPSVSIRGASPETFEAIRSLAESQVLRVVPAAFPGRKRVTELHPDIENRARQLRKRGLSFRSIARELGVGVSTAHRLASER